MNRSEALQKILENSDGHHEELMKRRKADELFYEPNPNSLYVWELKLRGRDRWEKDWTTFYATEDQAYLAACNSVITRNIRLTEWDQKWRKMFEEGRHKEATQYVAAHYSDFAFEVSVVEIRTSADTREISVYSEEIKKTK